MSNVLNNSNLIALEKALEAAGDVITLVMKVPAPLKSIADQVVRSASSVPANLAEGQGRSGRDRLHFWRISYASAKQVDNHMRLLARAGAINPAKAEEALSTFDEVRAMTWRLMNRNGSSHTLGHPTLTLSLLAVADNRRCFLSLYLTAAPREPRPHGAENSR